MHIDNKHMFNNIVRLKILRATTHSQCIYLNRFTDWGDFRGGGVVETMNYMKKIISRLVRRGKIKSKMQNLLFVDRHNQNQI